MSFYALLLPHVRSAYSASAPTATPIFLAAELSIPCGFSGEVVAVRSPDAVFCIGSVSHRRGLGEDVFRDPAFRMRTRSCRDSYRRSLRCSSCSRSSRISPSARISHKRPTYGAAAWQCQSSARHERLREENGRERSGHERDDPCPHEKGGEVIPLGFAAHSFTPFG